MRNRNDAPVAATSQRPVATEAEIRAMHDKAAAHQLAADKHEAQAQHDLGAAEHMATEMVANARAEANRIVREAQEQAATHQRQVDEHAAQLRKLKAAEEARATYWSTLAEEETARAGLTAIPPTAPLETVPDGEPS
jgi:hypothetical protein